MYPQFFLIIALSVLSNAQYLSCPLLGPDFPFPTNLQYDANIISAAQNLSSQIDWLLKSNSTTFDSSTSFSVQWFSTDTNESIYQYHYTGPSVAGSANGTTRITEDSIYRVGSVSKLYTMYLFLAEAGDAYLHRPITDFVPELADVSKKSKIDNVTSSQWSEITLGALASQLAGIARDDGQSDLLSYPVPWSDLGFPNLNSSELPACGFNDSVPTCTRKYFLEDIIRQPPVFAPFTTPIYSNNAFALLSFALESITNRSFPDMMSDMFDRLDLGSSFYTTPKSNSQGVIPWNVTYSGWAVDEAAGDPAGSIYASTADLSSFGRAILNSILISPTQTRRWMKPLSFTSNTNLAVGAPWEIYRIQNSNRVTDYYTKGGDIGVYSSLLALIPDYKAGFSIFTADGSASDVAATLSEMVSNTLGPALEAAARMQAIGKFAGLYNATDGLNSSVVIGLSNTFGLAVESWTSEGNDMFTNIALTQGITSTSIQILALLQPVDLKSVDEKTNTTSLPFRSVLGFAGPVPSNPFNLNCATWTTVDALNYGGLPLDLFIFRENTHGEVTGLTIPVLRLELERVNR